MAPEDQPTPEATQPLAPDPKAAPRRDRRPGRGRRGRGRGGRPKQVKTPGQATMPQPGPLESQEKSEADFESVGEPNEPIAPEAPQAELTEPPVEPLAPLPVEPPSQPASGTSVEKAIEEVSVIVESLRGALDEMEEVLEMLELFERQKNADEREIESLRRALRQIHRPREAGYQQRR